MKSSLVEGARNRTLAAGVLLPVAVLAAFRLLFVEPQTDLLAMRRVELEQRRGEVARARLAASRLPQLEAEVARLRPRLAMLRRGLPEAQDASAVLRSLQEVAVRSQLTMQSFALEETRVREGYEEWPVRLEVTGGFHELASFLDAVSGLPRIVTIDHLSIRALPSGKPNATIAATCIATTYVLREPVDGEDAVRGEGRLRR
ncbi:MAG: type 4a pilus biogenesis protein PilO [Acidobacteria bacterium]|nr:type 4a pilus biogenesis protein PilO [Acidobacteriota bacterium]